MVDIWTKTKRSDVMSRIRSKDTGPERAVRSMVHALGYRFRLHRNDLPGKPDIVLPKYGAVIFVNGCFWHQHKNCIDGRIPKSSSDYWRKKLQRNIEKDKENVKKLRKMGWKVLSLWECDIEKHPERVRKNILDCLRE